MKIASEIKLLALTLGVVALCEVVPHPVGAVPPPPPSSKDGAATTTTTVTASTGASSVANPSPSLVAPSSASTTSTSVASTPAATVTTTVTSTTPSALPPLPLPADNGKPVVPGSNMGALENKVPDSVKEAVKHLDKSSTEEVTLDDLNTARQAVAKIEALIDIEKHLAELDKVRMERNKGGFAGAIPASALQPPSAMKSTDMGGGQQMMAAPAERVTEVLRIMGRNGTYSAVMKLADDKTKTVKPGDHLSDGSKIVSITSTEVNVMRGTMPQTLHVKNVETVFGSAS